MNLDRYQTVTKTIFDKCGMTLNLMKHVLAFAGSSGIVKVRVLLYFIITGSAKNPCVK